MKKLLFLLLFFTGSNSYSQNCFSIGTGADGAYTATVNTSLVGGTYNFTSFTINPGVTVSVIGNSPLIVYCNGAVTIDGTLSANGGNGANGVIYSSGGIGGVGVAGGANGGIGSFASSSGPFDGTDGALIGGINTKGMAWSGGGGAGYAVNGMPSGNPAGGFAGNAYGVADLSTFLAGSGGGGGSGGYDCGAGGGGAGGGFISILANGITISATGTITANGGNGGSDGAANCGGGGGGSGGAVWIGAYTIQNNGLVSALGGLGGASNVPGSPYFGTGGNGAVGRIRIDVVDAVSGSGSINPTEGFVNNLAQFVSNQSVELCYGESISVGPNVHSTPGTFVDIIPTVVNGCDSIVTTTVVIEDELTSSQTLTICNGASLIVGSNEYTEGGTYTDVLSSVISGCDSTVISYLTVELPIDVTINETVGELTVVESGAIYQWIDCDNGNSEIFEETNQAYTPVTNGNYAVEVSVNGCTSISSCFSVDYMGISENSNQANDTIKLVKITDLLGRETEYQPNTVLIYIYSDGSIVRSMSFE